MRAGTTRRRHKVDVVLDLHHQGTYTDPDGRWSRGDDVAERHRTAAARGSSTGIALQGRLDAAHGTDSKGYANSRATRHARPLSRNAYGLLGRPPC